MPSGYRVLERMGQRVADLSGNFAAHLDRFEQDSPFSGPSAYFHRKTLALRSSHSSIAGLLKDDLFFDLLYATLTAWGLHRMGPGKTRLLDIEELKGSVRSQAAVLEKLARLTIITTLDIRGAEQVARELWPVLAALKVSAANVQLVANSKTLHHVLPALIPPIDRMYTFQFFYGRKMLTLQEREAFLEMFAGFHQLASTNAALIQERIGSAWNTSETKMIDNAIVGYMIGVRGAPPPDQGS